ncbi:MAG: polymer-forming cytoskeletal protein [Desulfobacterales bacterium]
MKKEKGTDRISTFIGADASIDGNIEFKGTIRVDGTVKGKISSHSGTVVVGEKAVVNAELFVNVAVIMGELNGTVVARERIEVYPPGRVGGDIKAPMVSIEPGGVFNGSCVMKGQSEKEAKPTIFVKNQQQNVKSTVK